MSRSLRTVLFVSIIGVTGCATAVGTALDTAARRTGEGIGSAIGAQAAGALSARLPAIWTPNLTGLYMNYLFTMAFHSGSYELDGTDYQPGEWTRWRMVDSDDPGQAPELERAFLHRAADGKEWWRVKFVSPSAEGRDSITVEALFDPNTGEFARMRGLMPGETEAKEMPVEQGSYGYVAPRRLTRESLEGATVGTAAVQVPAGRYNAQHVRYGGMGQGTYEWWMSDQVPGGLIKYSRRYSDRDADGLDPHNWTVELLGSGRNATSQLGVQY
jgi:hypothetical protein